ncbi:uncharacterized protein LOC126608764 isoform X2 [Malus sylvestris]|uniref:uncharacterized protein LOC126608764 isoform X2 n=1 Tax=Malus sylvestris TaxID=3752 RepID=UPI0021AD235C|nr:uncharacterized protein LOC126608764 isoform X2 [Malus sylvestris]
MDIGRQLLGSCSRLVCVFLFQTGNKFFLVFNIFWSADINAAVMEGQLEILEVLTRGGASQPACEEALLEASYLGRARSGEMLMGSDMIPALRWLCMLLSLLAAEASLMKLTHSSRLEPEQI